MTAPDADEPSVQQLISALAYAQSAQVVMDALVALPDMSAEGVRLLFLIPQVRALVRVHPHAGAHVITHRMHQHNLIRRAAYLAAAGYRMSTAARLGPSAQARAMAVERQWLQQHLAADAGRVVAADQVAATARQLAKRAQREPGFTWNGLLGWYATMDDRTSAECKKANGRNFDPVRIPPIGLPGTVHPHCRCRPGPPFPVGTDKRVEKVSPAREARRTESAWRVTLVP